VRLSRSIATNRLLEHVTRRIVTVTSVLHSIGRIDFDDLNWERRRYRPWRAYGDSKLANLLFTVELQRRLTEAGSPVKATAAHPGLASTNLKSHSDRALYRVAVKVLDGLVSQDAQSGALPTLYAAVADIPDNGVAGPAGLMEIRGGAKLVGRSGAAEDMNVAGRLWDVSEQLTGTRFPLTPRSADQMNASA
jgi:NAD(P)-dependent dehydrogenase (short-subunit alcohol dehydrogenase family)